MKAKIKRVIINPLAFIKIMTTGTCWRVNEGIPKLADLHGFTIDPQTQNLILFISHDSFDEVDVTNEVSPLHDLEIRNIQ